MASCLLLLVQVHRESVWSTCSLVSSNPLPPSLEEVSDPSMKSTLWLACVTMVMVHSALSQHGCQWNLPSQSMIFFSVNKAVIFYKQMSSSLLCHHDFISYFKTSTFICSYFMLHWNSTLYVLNDLFCYHRPYVVSHMKNVASHFVNCVAHIMFTD